MLTKKRKIKQNYAGVKVKKGRLAIVTHPYPREVWRARVDQAIITGQDVAERPWWYEDRETERTYYDLAGCIGWPTEVTDSTNGMPGYIGIIGILRTEGDARDARFLLLDEMESDDVQTLLTGIAKMRAKWGFGLHPDLLTIWHGDPDRFLTARAMYNELLEEDQAVIVAPPEDFYEAKRFDIYVRSLKSVLIAGAQRLFYGGCEVLKRRVKEFRVDDPVITAAGGLVHTLLLRTQWLDALQSGSVFSVAEG